MGKRKKGHDYRTVKVDEQSSDCELQLATTDQIASEIARRNVAFVLGIAYVDQKNVAFQVLKNGTDGLLEDLVQKIIEVV